MEPLADGRLTEFVSALAAAPAPPPGEVPAGALRAGARERSAARPPGPAMRAVRDVRVPGPGGPRPARVYRPSGAEPGVLLWFHGGGWVIGDLETHDRACRRLAERSGLAVVSVDYRLAPEHPWPAAVDDAVAAVRWARSRPEELAAAGTWIAVGGDSAGGALAALACLRLREEPGRSRELPDAQVLVYANTDLAAAGGSLDSEGTGYGLEREGIDWFYDQWVPDRAMRSHPAVSPLRAPDVSGLPPALVITCEHDPLRDQGEAFAARLQQAGVPTTLHREQAMVHNFLLWDLVSPACAAAGDRVADGVAALRGVRPPGPR